MKRNKMNRRPTQMAVIHPNASFEKEINDVGSDTMNLDEVSSLRMLENLKTALFFSRMQGQMGKEK